MRAAMTGPERSASETGEVALVRRVARGDEEAVARFYHAYADAVFRFIYRRVAERYEDAQDLTQETFLAAVACALTYDGSCAVFTWLCGMARVRIADFFRRQGRRKRVPFHQLERLEEAFPGGEESASARSSLEGLPGRLDDARLLDRTMAALREEEREALLLRYVEELSVREIAALMARSEKAIESLLIRAKKKAARKAAELL